MKVKSTSASSAECSDIILRTTSTTRLVFRPMLVENRNDASAAVKGTFLYQRKGPKDDWPDLATISLSSLKKDEGYRLELRSGELLPLVQQLNALYELHGEHGVPQGEVQFLQLADSLQDLSSLDRTEFRSFLEAHRAVGANLLNRLLTWVSSMPDVNRLLEYLEPLEEGALHVLRTASGIRALETTLRYWESRVGEAKEDFWQEALADNSFVLEQIYSWPVTIVEEKAYVGGKTCSRPWRRNCRFPRQESTHQERGASRDQDS